MQCNIDARGKAVRLILGIILALVGGVVLLTSSGNTGGIISGLCFLVGGGFTIFEGAAGWCVVRAMGFKTKL